MISNNRQDYLAAWMIFPLIKKSHRMLLITTTWCVIVKRERERNGGGKGVRRTLDETREGGFNFQHSQLLLNEKTANLIKYAPKDETMVINQSKWKRKTSSSSSSTTELLLCNSSISVKKRENKKKKKGNRISPTDYMRCRQLLHIKWHLIISSWGMRATVTRLLADGFIIAHIFSFVFFYFWSSVRVYLKIGRSFMQL